MTPNAREGKRALTLLLDANVWLDNYLPFREGHADAVRLVGAACERLHTLLFPIANVGDLFYLLNSQLKKAARMQTGTLTEADAHATAEMAWSCIRNMREIATPVGADISDLWVAERYRSAHADLEDNLVLAAALRANADCLVTSDRQLLATGIIAATTPTAALKLIAC